MNTFLKGVAALVLASSAVLAPALSASASTPSTSHHYSSCAAVHHYYSGGIAKVGVYYNTIHHANGTVTKVRLSGHVLHSNTAYKVNHTLDRDRDGVACER